MMSVSYAHEGKSGNSTVQLYYLQKYLESLQSKTVIHESHYIDRDYIEDYSLFYSRNLRPYPNHCERYHFFDHTFDKAQFQEWFAAANSSNPEKTRAIEAELSTHYLGFIATRPLAGSPIGRTILKANSRGGAVFPVVSRQSVHMLGLELSIEGLPFQQQDQGVSACATTALWVALQRARSMGEIRPVSPAEITQMASQFSLPNGRALPSEGLTLPQLCEAVRGVGLAPTYISISDLATARGQIYGFLASGYAPVAAVFDESGEFGHAVCCVGYELGGGDSGELVSDAADNVTALYLHDDRVGPYVRATVREERRRGDGLETWLDIEWPVPLAPESLRLGFLLVPVPQKLRLPLSRIRMVAKILAQAVAQLLGGKSKVQYDVRYRIGTEYFRSLMNRGLATDALWGLVSQTTVSRSIGLVTLQVDAKESLHLAIDTTETPANPSVLALIPLPGCPEPLALRAADLRKHLVTLRI
jgi:hypothetical protein